jgi:NAD(P)-dependent dehydrogenase (short-subunit alcohol dehydrogenase family)
MSMKEKVVIITGAGRGVGRATAQLFAREGAHVVLFGRTRAHLEETAATITQEDGQALLIEGDVAREEDVAALFQQVRERYGRVDILME